MLSQSTGSTAHPFMHNEDMDVGLGGDAPLLYNVHTSVNTNVYSAVDNMNTDDATIDILADDVDNTIDMDTGINVDALHVYIHGCDPKGRGFLPTLLDPGA